jgi:hypothetical protein
MLDGFGLAPVCLELDLDSYDGPWTHVSRFRGRSGWLAVAEATLSGGGTEWTTSIVAACDEWGEAVPSFMAPNLLACACSLPEPCCEFPPEELDEALRTEGDALKLRWLRDNSQALRKLDVDTAERVAALEAEARRKTDALDLQLADLRRRRRMPGVSPSAMAVFSDLIREAEELQDFVQERLNSERSELRAALAQLERKLMAESAVRIELELLWCANWSARAPASEDRDFAKWLRTQPCSFHAGSSRLSREAASSSEEILAGLQRMWANASWSKPTSEDMNEAEAPCPSIPEQKAPARADTQPTWLRAAEASRTRSAEDASLRHEALLVSVRAQKVAQELAGWRRLGPVQLARLQQRHDDLRFAAAELDVRCKTLSNGHPARKRYSQAVEYLRRAEARLGEAADQSSETIIVSAVSKEAH